MSYWLVAAAVVLIGVSIVHSHLGERYIIRRLLRRENLPELFGSDWFTKRTLRFAWHLTTVAWVGLAIVLVVLARHFGDPPQEALLTAGRDPLQTVGYVVAAVLLLSGALAAAGSRGRHLAWVAFAASGVLTLIGIA